MEKRGIVSKIMELVETAKRNLAQNTFWQLEIQDEEILKTLFSHVIPNGTIQPERLEYSNEVLKKWIERTMRPTRHAVSLASWTSSSIRPAQSLDEAMSPLFCDFERTFDAFAVYQANDRDVVDLPLHRIRTLAELLPDSLKGPEHANADKLAVVHGADRCRFGNPILFSTLPEEPVFKRYLGTVVATQGGMQLDAVLVHRGQKRPASVTVSVPPNSNFAARKFVPRKRSSI